MTQQNDWYHISNIQEIDSPALIVYPSRVKENISILLSMIDDRLRLRPHVKTHKTKEATKLMMEAGISKFKCATIAEAEMLAICGAKDVLLAYQPVGPKLVRFVSLIKKYPLTLFSCLIDSVYAARQMADVFAQESLTVPVYIDLNTGMNRTGIAPGKPAIELYMQCSSFNGITPAGLQLYDGHIRQSDFQLRTAHCDENFSAAKKIAHELSAMGFSEPIIVAGGSPTFSIHSKRQIVECSPGTFIYWDKGYLSLCPEQAFIPAALVITRVISLPDKTRLCLDLGHKSIASENDLSKRVYFLNAPGLIPVSQSEEHLVVEAGTGHSYKIGDVLFGLPFHICPTCALYERAITIEENRSSGEWKIIARDRRIEC